MKKPFWQRVGGFLAGKGFYIVLFLCVAAIGISGYYLLSSLNPDEEPTLQTTATAQISVPSPTPTPTPIPVPPSPSPSPSPKASPVTPSPSPAPSPSPSAAAKSTALVFTWPVKGGLDRDFSLEALAYDETMGDWRTHSGIDIAAELGTQVLATARGVVVASYQDDLMGTTVCIDHGDGLVSYYANLAASPAVEIGDSVETGTVIGAVGNTAIAESTRPSHLHFEMEKDGVAVDPMKYLPTVG